MKRGGRLPRRTPLTTTAPLRARRARPEGDERPVGGPWSAPKRQRARTPPEGPAAARKRLPRRSAKAKAAAGTRRDVVMAVLARDGWRCRIGPSWPEAPCGGPLDGHEPLPRSRGGDPLDADQVVTACRAHHDAVHANPRLARERGWTL